MFEAADGKIKVLIMAYGLGNVCVFVYLCKFFFIQSKQGIYSVHMCDYVCISHKVSSNWETAALTLTVELYVKITHAYVRTRTKTQSVSPQRLSPILLVRTLIRAKRQKARQREWLGKKMEFVKDKYSVWHQFCFWLFYFSSSTAGKT